MLLLSSSRPLSELFLSVVVENVVCINKMRSRVAYVILAYIQDLWLTLNIHLNFAFFRFSIIQSSNQKSFGFLSRFLELPISTANAIPANLPTQGSLDPSHPSSGVQIEFDKNTHSNPHNAFTYASPFFRNPNFWRSKKTMEWFPR